MNPGTNNFHQPERGSIRPLERHSFRIKSQAVAFLLGFALTSVVLLCIPGLVGKKTAHADQHNSTLAGVVNSAAAADSTAITRH